MMTEWLQQQRCDPWLSHNNPGVRLICVSGGPCTSLDAEVASGTQVFSEAKQFVAEKAVEGLRPFLTTPSNFAHPPFDSKPIVFHDGRPKSKGTYEVFKAKSLMAFEDGMSPPSSSRFQVHVGIVWYTIINRLVENATTTRPVILFCSVNTMYRILRTLNLITDTARIIISSGGYLVINIPRHALPSFNVGCGPWAWQSLVWAVNTKDEYHAYQDEEMHKEERRLERKAKRDAALSASTAQSKETVDSSHPDE
jgi:hypothetical protein